MLKRFIEANVRASAWQQRLIDGASPRARGWWDFVSEVAPTLVGPGLRVLDVGGGKRPLYDAATCRKYGLEVTGLDLSADELAQAPEGAYRRTVVGDVASVAIPGEYDLIVSCAVLEHVERPRAALANLASALAPGGRMAHFVPCAWAPFAVLNRALGPTLSRRVLFAVFPEKRVSQGFPAHYRDCTPSRFRAILRENGLSVERLDVHWASDYGTFFLPLYTLETLRQLAVMATGIEDLAETFTVVASRPPG